MRYLLKRENKFFSLESQAGTIIPPSHHPSMPTPVYHSGSSCPDQGLVSLVSLRQLCLCQKRAMSGMRSSLSLMVAACSRNPWCSDCLRRKTHVLAVLKTKAFTSKAASLSPSCQCHFWAGKQTCLPTSFWKKLAFVDAACQASPEERVWKAMYAGLVCLGWTWICRLILRLKKTHVLSRTWGALIWSA